MGIKDTGKYIQTVRDLYATTTNEMKNHSPVLGDYPLNTDMGDNAKFLTVGMEVMNMPMIDMNDAEQVKKRIDDYFAIMIRADMKPTISGLAMALNNMTRTELLSIVNKQTENGSISTNLSTEVLLILAKAHEVLTTLWENYMQNGKINPVSGIFLGKNNYGYVDKVEHVLTPRLPKSSDFSEEDIRSRYMIEDENGIVE